MAKKIKQSQIFGNIVQSVTGDGVNNADPKNPVISQKTVTGVAFSGTSTKTLTITFSDGSTLQGTFTDLNTTYTGMTAGDLTTGTDTTNKLIAANILVDYINSRLSAVFKYKGSVATFAALPTTGQAVGDTYNVVAAFSLSGEDYPAGTNVAWNGTGWDPLAGFLDTSNFLTEETDPTGVAGITVTGTATKTITITLNNGQTKTATFTDDNTTYTNMSAAEITTGTATTGRIISAKVLNDWLLAKGYLTEHLTGTTQAFVIAAGNIASGVVTVTLSNAPVGGVANCRAYLNGVKIPVAATSIASSTQFKITQSGLADPIEVTDEVEVWYQYE
jgi:hypothetical protein